MRSRTSTGQGYGVLGLFSIVCFVPRGIWDLEWAGIGDDDLRPWSWWYEEETSLLDI